MNFGCKVMKYILPQKLNQLKKPPLYRLVEALDSNVYF